jgi:hypothetical protein
MLKLYFSWMMLLGAAVMLQNPTQAQTAKRIIPREAPVKLFTKKDLLTLTTCNCDSVLKNTGEKDRSTAFDGSGPAALFNLEKKMARCGYFRNYRLLYGLEFGYNKKGELEQVKRYFNGRMIGTCEVH